MKKILMALALAIIFVLLFVLCVSATDTNESAEQAEGDIILGDVNGDGLITNADVLMIYRYIYNSGLYPLPTICSHSYGDWTIETLATCETDGEISRTCTKCSENETSTVKGGHYYEETVVDPTPADEGYTEHTCKRCGDSFKDNIIPALGFTSGFAYTVNSDNKTCTVIGLGSVTDTKIAIPEEIDGYTVTAIGEKAFENKTEFTEIIIPDTVETIGKRAFYGCTGITEMTIPASVTSIGTQIFYKASNLATVYYNSTYYNESNPFLNLAHIKKVVFGGEYVPAYILYNCESVKEAVISNGVKFIDFSAFYGCTSLENITIPESVTKIGDYVFRGCTSLESITIGDSVTSIGNDAFRGCRSLVSIKIPGNVTKFGDGAFYGCTSLESITIGDSVTSISNDAFRGCISLTSITIPNSVMSIGSSAFEGCTSLMSIAVGNSVTSIGSSVFRDCTSLTNITIPDSVISIGSSAFSGCTSLMSIEIPDSVMSIGFWAFSGCASLKNVYIFDIEAWLNISFWENNDNPCYYGANLYLNGELLTSVNVPDSVTSISNSAFSGCTSLESVTIPDSVTSIGSSAFSGCTSLMSIAVGNSVTSIGSSAFCDCTSLANITIPDSVTSIGNYAFSGCTSLMSITIADNVESIGYNAFSDCYKLVEVINKSKLSIIAGSDSNGSVAYYAIEVHTGDSKIIEIDGFLFYTCNNNINYLVGYNGNKAELTLTDSFNGENYEIYNYAFDNCTSLESITIPFSVTSIGNSAFDNCTLLKDVYYTGTQEQWDKVSINYLSNIHLLLATIHYNYVAS